MKTASENRREARQAEEDRAIAMVDHLLKEAAPALYSRQKGAGLSREASENLVARLQEEIDTAHLVAARKHLRSLLKELREVTGGEVCLPSPATYIKRDKSPFAGKNIALAGALESLLEAFMTDIRQNLSQTSTASQTGEREAKPASEKQRTEQERKQRLRTLGRILFSAVVNGGLLHKDLYRRLPTALCDTLQASGDMAWVTFLLDETEDDEGDDTASAPVEMDAAVRRWFLDPITLGLVTRWRAKRAPEDYRSEVTRTSARNALVHYLKYLHSLPKADPHWNEISLLQVNDLFQAARTRLSLYLPPVLIRFLSSIAQGQSMSERTWWRYQYGLVVDQMARTESPSEMTPELADISRRKAEYRGDSAAFFRLQSDFMGALQQCFNEPGSKEKTAKNEVAVKRIARILEAREDEMAPLVNAYCQWIAWKLSRPSQKQGRIVCSSASRYTSRLGKHLVALGAEVSFESMSDTDWEELYADVMECMKSDHDRSKAPGNLRDFHRFLMIAYDVPPAIIEGQADPSARSRATIITDDDYSTLMKLLSCGDQPSHQVRLLRIISMLMFRVGLRPNELVGLEYGHIQGASKKQLSDGTAWPVLYLRATSRGRLKTPSGVRQIPLAWFLSDQELEEFNGFLLSRISMFKESNQHSAIVLTPSLGVNTPIPEKQYFGLLTDLLRAVTGDPNVVAYTLRHGCLSNLFFGLLDPQRGEDHAFLRNGLLPREATYALSTLGGHLDPDISMQSYVHTQDILCHHHLRKQFEDTPIAIWAALEGKKEASLHQRRTRKASGEGGEDEQPQWRDTSRRLVRQLALEVPKARVSREIELPDLVIKEPSLLDLDIETIHALLVSFMRKHSARARAELFSLPGWQIEGFREACQRLAGYKTVSTSATQNLRNLKPVKERQRLPELYRRAQPGSLGPAPPHHSREEMIEANRVYRLLAGRAAERGLEKDALRETIIEPIRDLLLAHSGSEAVIRVIEEDQFTSATQAIKDLSIPPDRMEIEIEALPRTNEPSPAAWTKQLKKLARSRKIRVSEKSQTVTRRSQAHPNFGSVKLRVLALTGPDVGEVRRKSKMRVTNRAASGWRVGGFYAVAAISALIWAKRSIT